LTLGNPFTQFVITVAVLLGRPIHSFRGLGNPPCRSINQSATAEPSVITPRSYHLSPRASTTAPGATPEDERPGREYGKGDDDQAPGGDGRDGLAVGGAVDVILVVRAAAVTAIGRAICGARASGLTGCAAGIATVVAIVWTGSAVFTAIAAAVATCGSEAQAVTEHIGGLAVVEYKARPLAHGQQTIQDYLDGVDVVRFAPPGLNNNGCDAAGNLDGDVVNVDVVG
jgi:hypothetical protein